MNEAQLRLWALRIATDTAPRLAGGPNPQAMIAQAETYAGFLRAQGAGPVRLWALRTAASSAPRLANGPDAQSIVAQAEIFALFLRGETPGSGSDAPDDDTGATERPADAGASGRPRQTA